MNREKQSTLNFELANFEQDQTGPVKCLGMTFENDEADREIERQ